MPQQIEIIVTKRDLIESIRRTCDEMGVPWSFSVYDRVGGRFPVELYGDLARIVFDEPQYRSFDDP